MHWRGKSYLKKAQAMKSRLEALMGEQAKQLTFEMARELAQQ